MLKSQVKKKEKRRIMNVRVTKSERDAIVRKAKRYTSGVITAWVIYAATQLDARAEDLAKKNDDASEETPPL